MGTYFKKMVGQRIYLSPMDPEDYVVYTRWLNDLEVTRNLTLAHRQITLDNEREALERISQEHNYAIVTLDGDILIGNCGLMGIDNVNRTAELGLFIGDAGYRGRGFGGETIGLLLDYGFNYLNLNNIMLRYFAYNNAGKRCYEKSGFRQIGCRRQAKLIGGQYYDEIYMDILASEYASKG